MKTNLIFLLTLLLTGFFFDASAFSSFASTRKKQQNIQTESVKKQIFTPMDSLNTHENKADSSPGNILDLDLQIKGYRPKIIHITTDGGRIKRV
jgi:hypothetical protein